MSLASPWPLVAGAVLASAGFAGGWMLADRLAEGRIAKVEARRTECEQARERDARAAAEKSVALLARAQDAEAEAARQMSARQAATRQRIEETRREIYRLADGRECLSGALRLRLNAALAPAGDLPQAAGDADRTAAAATADSVLPSPAGRGDGGEGATDADIAGWIVEAAGLYDDCRARIDALRAWDAQMNPARP